MVNVAILGVGNIAAAHIAGYLKFPERCKIVALVDIDMEKAHGRNREFSLNAHVYSNIAELRAKQLVDVVSICTPPFTHRDLAVECLSAGIHVVCEKPMASSLEESDDMLSAQRKSGALLSVVTNNRYLTPVVALKKVIDSGLAGKILHATVNSYWWRGFVYYDLWWRGTWEKEGGGCTLNHGVHHIDMFQWLMGMPSSVTSTLANLAHGNAEVEDYSVSIFRYPDNRIGVVSASVVHHGEEQQMIFQCENARISYPWAVYASTAKPNGFPVRNTELEEKLTAVYESVDALSYEGHLGQIDNFLSAVEGKGSVLSDGMEGRKTLELISAVYQSGTTGKEVRLPLSKEDPFYSREGILGNAIHFHEKSGSREYSPKG